MKENLNTKSSNEQQAPHLRVGDVSSRFLNKLFFRADEEEHCFKLSDLIDIMKSEGLSEMKIYEAVKEKGTGFFYCKFFSECGEIGECGKQCSEYKPKNNRAGICKYYGYTYYANKEFILTNLD